LATTTPLQVLPVPQSSDAPDGPTQITSLARAVEQRTVMVFASAAARTAAFTAAAISPAAGMLCWRSDAGGSNKFEYFNATAGSWRIHGAYQDFNVTASATPSITFSSIPAYLRRLAVTVTCRGDTAATAVTLNLRINSDATASYTNALGYQNNTVYGTPPITAGGLTSSILGWMPAATGPAGVFGAFDATIIGWDVPHVGQLTYRCQGGYMATSTDTLNAFSVGRYVGANPYTSVTLLPAAGNFVAGSQFVLSGSE
jgi:hypothetical protein